MQWTLGFETPPGEGEPYYEVTDNADFVLGFASTVVNGNKGWTLTTVKPHYGAPDEQEPVTEEPVNEVESLASDIVHDLKSYAEDFYRVYEPEVKRLLVGIVSKQFGK